MSEFAVVVFEEGSPSYVAGRYESSVFAAIEVGAMAQEVYGEESLFLFDGDDDIVIVNPDFSPLVVWNRAGCKSADVYSTVNFAEMLAEDAARRANRVIGFQITDEACICIHGTDEDPFDLNADAILVGEAVIAAKAWAADRGYLVSEVYSQNAGDYERVEALQVPSEPQIPASV